MLNHEKPDQQSVAIEQLVDYYYFLYQTNPGLCPRTQPMGDVIRQRALETYLWKEQLVSTSMEQSNKKRK